MFRLRNLLGLLAVLCLVGCGEESKPAKTALSDSDKAQVQQLNSQRATEWAKRKKT